MSDLLIDLAPKLPPKKEIEDFNVVSLINKGAINIVATGSRYICDPPTTTTDEDYLVLVKELDSFIKNLEEDGWDAGVDEDGYENDDRTGESGFISLRNGRYNLIVTQDPDFFDKFHVATEAAKEINLLKKEDRITLFRAVLYQLGPRDL